MANSAELRAETLNGTNVSFSYAAYCDSIERYNVKDIEAFVERIENKKPWQRIDPAEADFFRDFAAIQEQAHSDFDRGIAIGSLATRIELATGQVPDEKIDATIQGLEVARVEYDLVFG